MASKSDIETMGITIATVGVAFIAGGIILNMVQPMLQPDIAARGRAMYARRYGL